MNQSFRFEERETLVAYLDLANMFGWQGSLGWKFEVEDLMADLKRYSTIKQVKIYYGIDHRNDKSSKSFHARLKNTGAIITPKPVKYIRKGLHQIFLINQTSLTPVASHIKIKIQELSREIRNQNIQIHEPKCNFDVEIAMDMLRDKDRFSGILLFSGDSDFQAPLKYLKNQGKSIYVCGTRGRVAKELFDVCGRFLDFGKFYQGKRHPLKRKIPTGSGSA